MLLWASLSKCFYMQEIKLPLHFSTKRNNVFLRKAISFAVSMETLLYLSILVRYSISISLFESNRIKPNERNENSIRNVFACV